MSQLHQRDSSSTTTILGLLTHQIDTQQHEGPRRRRSLKDRLRFTGIGCCGAHWIFRLPTLTLRDAQQQQPPQPEVAEETPLPRHHHDLQETNSDQAPASSGMNLAAALAAERQIRGGEEGESSSGEVVGPWRVSLMRLLEETGEEREKEVGNDWVCCVCMGRKKGAAFIPCGHTYCRVCSRELWLNRGTCPLCNHSILEILDIF